jgi:two-component system response regulator AtoC
VSETYTRKINVLIIGTELELTQLLTMKINSMGHNSVVAQDPGECLSMLDKTENIQTVILDISNPEIDGMNMLAEIKAAYINLPVIVLTISSSIDLAKIAIEKGGYDYLIKPYDLSRITVVLTNALSFYKLKNEVGDLQGKVRRSNIYQNIIGESAKINEMFKRADWILGKDVSVLILGESGTGKELLAKAIHLGSSRTNGPFVIVNCAAITQELADSLLFGHKKGSFTGALMDHIGFFEQANQGTIFLDEIGDMNIDIQAKVLRVIEEKKVRRVGEKVERDINFRIISATNRDLTAAITTGEFRGDLYYRLNEYPIYLPALRERQEDIPLLSNFFLKEFCELYEIEYMSMAQDVMEELQRYAWPGNIRELKNIISRFAIQSPGPVIDMDQFDDIMDAKTRGHEKEKVKEKEKEKEKEKPLKSAEPQLQDDTFEDNQIIPLDVIERREIEKAITILKGNVDRAALALGLSRATLYRKLKQYGLLNK